MPERKEVTEVKQRLRELEREKKKEEEKKEEKPAKAVEKVEEAEEKVGKKEREEKEKEKKEEEKKKEEEEKILEEKMITVSLARAWRAPRTRRTKAAAAELRRQLTKHLKKPLRISTAVNEKLWERGMKRPARKLRVRAQITKKVAIILPAS